MRIQYLVLSVSLFLLVGCYSKPEPGPAEQIGRGIDQITKGLQAMDAAQSENAAKLQAAQKAEQERLAKERQEEMRQRNIDDGFGDLTGDYENGGMIPDSSGQGRW